MPPPPPVSTAVAMSSRLTVGLWAFSGR
jgi:hypothetical protein